MWAYLYHVACTRSMGEYLLQFLVYHCEFELSLFPVLSDDWVDHGFIASCVGADFAGVYGNCLGWEPSNRASASVHWDCVPPDLDRV